MNNLNAISSRETRAIEPGVVLVSFALMSTVHPEAFFAALGEHIRNLAEDDGRVVAEEKGITLPPGDVFSVHSSDGQPFYILTDVKRGATLVVLPEEF